MATYDQVMADHAKVEQLRKAFATGGEWEPCEGDDSSCSHGECEAARFVLSVID